MKRERISLAVAAVILLAGLLAPPAEAIPLSARAIYFEINDTDGDAGVQIFLDGEGWDSMQVTDPNGKVILNVLAEGSVGLQGITELFLESAEPSFEEQPLEDLLALFPAGRYRFRGATTEGRVLRGSARLTHVLPDAAEFISPEEEAVVDPDDLVIAWEPVDDPPGSAIIGYQVLVVKDEGRVRVFQADMGPNATSVTVPPEFLLRGTTYKSEILVVERSGNRTITELEFDTED